MRYTKLRCEGILEVDGGSVCIGNGESRRNSYNNSQARDLPVKWQDIVQARALRKKWITEYCCVGAIPNVVREHLSIDATVNRVLTQCTILTNRDRQRHIGEEYTSFTSDLVVKLLQRGKSAPSTINVENNTLKQHNLLASLNKLNDGEIGWKATSDSFQVGKQELLSHFAIRKPFVLQKGFEFSHSRNSMFDSILEDKFLNQWVPQSLGEHAGHWLIPQAPLDRIIEASGGRAQEDRRVDFVFSHPCGEPFVIEIDGPEHETEKTGIDENRDKDLGLAGLTVFRVPNSEVDAGNGPNLSKIKKRISRILSRSTVGCEQQIDILRCIHDCTYSAKLQFVIARAIGYGWLPINTTWHIKVNNACISAEHAIVDLLGILDAFDSLYGGKSVPNICMVTLSRKKTDVFCLQRNDKGIWKRRKKAKSQGNEISLLRISLESDVGPYHQINVPEDTDIIIRPVDLPVEIGIQSPKTHSRRKIVDGDSEEIMPALKFFLQHIFRKEDFREMQCSAVMNVLHHKDTVVLLPTGAGKSLIYQLAGLLMPGITLVVDPLTSLIVDQCDGLLNFGIDRTQGFARDIAGPAQREKNYNLAEQGEYYFVLNNPELLQSERMKRFIKEYSSRSIINLAVIDEAHCVSEWGHNFRPAYLTVGETLRELGKAMDKKSSPPLLGLTGTASRSVRRDLLASLKIDQNIHGSLICPVSFNRKELNFEILPSKRPDETLKTVLNKLPSYFKFPPEEFFSPSGRNTNSGIIFTPTVNGKLNGVKALESIVKRECSSVSIYSGKVPKYESGDWKKIKMANSKAFINNQTVVLVATNAFGMGIDKPNIRFTVHYGMSRSLESFYQEAGRAGRDRNKAYNIIIFYEKNETLSNTLLDPSLSLKELRDTFDSKCKLPNGKPDWSKNDDVVSSIYFHLKSFTDIEQHINEVVSLIDRMKFGDSEIKIEYRRKTEEEESEVEKALLRLKTLGLVTSYTKNWNDRILTCDTIKYNRDICIDHLVKYVESTQPYMAATKEVLANNVKHGNDREEIVELVTILIEYIYDVIEKSRRHMIEQSMKYVRDAYSDKDAAGFRKKLLSYLQEGQGYEDIRSLCEKKSVDYDAFWDLGSQPNLVPLEADELRNRCGRLLEDYPDHPGLFLTRAIAESRCGNADSNKIATDFVALIRYGLQNPCHQDILIDEVLMNKILNHTNEKMIIGLAVSLARYSERMSEESNYPNIDMKKLEECMYQLSQCSSEKCNLISMSWLVKLCHSLLLDNIESSIDQKEIDRIQRRL